MRLSKTLLTLIVLFSAASMALAANQQLKAQDLKPFYATGVIGNAGDNLADVLVRRAVDDTSYERVRVENPEGLNDFGWLRFVAKGEKSFFRLYRCFGTVNPQGVFQPKDNPNTSGFTTYSSCDSYLDQYTITANQDVQVRTGFYMVRTRDNNFYPGVIEVRRNIYNPFFCIIERGKFLVSW